MHRYRRGHRCLVLAMWRSQTDVGKRENLGHEEPWSFPPASVQSLLGACGEQSAQMVARNGGSIVGRKRKLLTFSEITDAFVEEGVRTERQAWIVAKRRKELGDDTLFNTLGNSKCVGALIAKVKQAWACESMTSGTLITELDFPLRHFLPVGSVDKRPPSWMKKDFSELVLILCGKGGLGKTELACAL